MVNKNTKRIPASPHYDAARQIASIILRDSDTEAGITDLLLYGSTLTSPTPKDLDLLIIHFGQLLASYTTSRSLLEEGEEIHSYQSSTILYMCNAGRHTVFDKVAALLQDKMLIPKIQDGDTHPDSLNELLDLHTLNGTMLMDEGEVFRGIALYFAPKDRKHAIEFSGKDRFFFHRVFANGWVFNPVTGDFSGKMEEKYPGVLNRFPSEAKPEFYVPKGHPGIDFDLANALFPK